MSTKWGSDAAGGPNGTVAFGVFWANELLVSRLGQLSPRVTVAEITVDCPAVELAGVGSVPLSGTLIVDIAELPASGLR